MNIVRPSCESNTTMPKRDLKSLLTEEEEKGEPTNTADVKKAKLVHSELAQRLHRLRRSPLTIRIRWRNKLRNFDISQAPVDGARFCASLSLRRLLTHA